MALAKLGDMLLKIRRLMWNLFYSLGTQAVSRVAILHGAWVIGFGDQVLWKPCEVLVEEGMATVPNHVEMMERSTGLVFHQRH